VPRTRPARPVPHEDGTLAEIARAGWPELVEPIVQVHLTTTMAGRVRAWGLHRRSTDRLFVIRGLVSIVVYDGRADSPTVGSLNEFSVSERNPNYWGTPAKVAKVEIRDVTSPAQANSLTSRGPHFGQGRRNDTGDA